MVNHIFCIPFAEWITIFPKTIIVYTNWIFQRSVRVDFIPFGCKSLLFSSYCYILFKYFIRKTKIIQNFRRIIIYSMENKSRMRNSVKLARVRE